MLLITREFHSMHFSHILLPLPTPPQTTHTSIYLKNKVWSQTMLPSCGSVKKISCFLRTENQFHAMVINETGFKVLIPCPLCLPSSCSRSISPPHILFNRGLSQVSQASGSNTQVRNRIKPISFLVQSLFFSNSIQSPSITRLE